MKKHLCTLILAACGIPGLALAELPVMEPSPVFVASGSSGSYAGSGVSTPPSAQGELFMQLQQLQQEIARLRGVLEEHEHMIRQLKQEGLERYQDLDQRISGHSSATAVSPSTSSDVSAQAAIGDETTASTGDPAQEKLYYDAAFDFIKQKDFDKANQAFNAFLRKYPNGQYAGNAQYWLGEVNLAQGDLQAAGRAFATVTQSFPHSQKIPDALYKLADVERRLGNTEKARGFLQQVISQYPGTSAAQLAQRMLGTL